MADERTPLLTDIDVNGNHLDVVHGAEPSTASTLINTNSILPTLPNNTIISKRNWVPDPLSEREASRPRVLILCFDGTGDEFDDDNSNIVQFVSCLKKDDQRHQLVYYQAGIGTYTKSSMVTPLTTQVSEVLDEMIAWNLSSHVQEGYQFLMQNYTAGDKIAIFGFSRGAYTARALAGMVQKVGLLPACNLQQIPFAWAMYTRSDEDGLRNSVGFRQTFSIEVQIDFVGVWDTVASVGLANKELPFVGNNTAIRVFRHALSLDEHRVKFMPNFYKASADADPNQATSALGVTAGLQGLDNKIASAFTVASPAMTPSSSSDSKKAKNGNKKRSEVQKYEDDVNAQGRATDAKEVWFAGCHCDIGGGSVANNTPYALARIPLRWMIRECFLANTGIIFDADILRDEIGIDATKLYPIVKPRGPRLPAPFGSVIDTPKVSTFGIPQFLTVVGSLIAIPLRLVFNIVIWPINHLWLLIKFTKPIKKLCKKLGLKATAPTNTPAPSTKTPQPKRAPFVSEEVEELTDALQAEYDQLSLHWYWWILEIIPMKFREQKKKRDDFFVRANLGKGRKIYGDARARGLNIHRSVKTRLEVKDNMGNSVYRPRAWFKQKDQVTNKKVEGPHAWDIDHPDPETQWRWVD